MHFILKALLFSFIVVIINNCISYTMCNFACDKKDAMCKKPIKKKQIIDIILFVTAFISFLLYEKLNI